MRTTGYQDMKPDNSRPRLPEMLHYLDRATTDLGLPLNKWPELDKAREHKTRADELRATLADRVRDARAEVAAAGHDYNAGKVTASELVDRATAAATLISGDSADNARQMIEAAALAVETEGAPLLHGIPEAKWLKVLRPAIADALAAANREADALAIEPRPQRANVVEHAHPWAPDARTLRDNMDVRHKWERLGAALERLDRLHSFADQLRTWRCLPVVPGREAREDYRWLRVERLQGSLSEDYRVFFLINRHAAEPGIYTAEEMDPAPVTAEPAALVDAHAANGGVREG